MGRCRTWTPYLDLVVSCLVVEAFLVMVQLRNEAVAHLPPPNLTEFATLALLIFAALGSLFAVPAYLWPEFPCTWEMGFWPCLGDLFRFTGVAATMLPTMHFVVSSLLFAGRSLPETRIEWFVMVVGGVIGAYLGMVFIMIGRAAFSLGAEEEFPFPRGK